MWNLELPNQMNPCLRTFIVFLHNESTGERYRQKQWSIPGDYRQRKAILLAMNVQWRNRGDSQPRNSKRKCMEGYHDETPRGGKAIQNKHNNSRNRASHRNDARHGKGSYGTNTSIDGGKKYCPRPRRFCGWVRVGERLQTSHETG